MKFIDKKSKLKLSFQLLSFKIGATRKIIDFMLYVSKRLLIRNGIRLNELSDLIDEMKENDIYE